MVNERFRFNCVIILALPILFHPFPPYCHPELVKDTSSNIESRDDYIEERPNKADASIERIFLGPPEKRNDPTSPKLNLDREANKIVLNSKESGKCVRVKRQNAIKKSSSKVANEALKVEGKREASSRSSQSLSKTGRSSKDQSKLKQSIDYEVAADQEGSEYIDEAEDESASSPESKEAKYKAREIKVAEDSDRFIDQEERSSLYDDFESKDVVKRGISGAEDYEEMEDDSAGAAEEIAALDEQDSFEEDSEKAKVRGDVRVKRQHENAKEITSKEDTPAASPGNVKDTEALKVEEKEAPVVEEQSSKVVQDSSELGERSKANVAEKQGNDESKVSTDGAVDSAKSQFAVNDPAEVNENVKSLKEDSQVALNDRKIEEQINLSNEKKAPVETSSLEGSLKLNEPKVVEVSNPDTSKEIPMNVAESPVSEEVLMLDNSRNLEDEDYEKRVEEQIQKKIDSIKEEIKREIADKHRLREIEANNAKFDELREEEDDEQAEEASESRGTLTKRSLQDSSKSQARKNVEKRSIKRKKRHDEISQSKLQRSAEPESNVDKKLVREDKQAAPLEEDGPKREVVRQVFVVRHDRSGRKKRRRRSKDPVPAQNTVKLKDNQVADLPSDSSLRGDLGESKQQFVPSKVEADEKTIAEEGSLSERKSGSVASLTGSNEELGPLATEYGEAFGGLHGEPGVALARFKRIKRVLRQPASKP